MIGLFCKRALKKRRYSAKETYHFKEPTNRSHPIRLRTVAINTLQHTATPLQHTATHCKTLQRICLPQKSFYICLRTVANSTLQHTATHCNTLQHTATRCNTLQHTATHCNTLQHTATHCNTLQHTTTHLPSSKTFLHIPS